jgi:DNA polymerase-3 subunit delta'
MPFAELTAQERAVGTLRAALRRGALHHAWLFGGPKGVGKRRAAILLAQAANCEAGEAGPGGLRQDPCGRCAPCRKIGKLAAAFERPARETRVHPDVHLLGTEAAMARDGVWEPPSGRAPARQIVVDQVRDLVDHRLSMRRVEARRRFVIVDPADEMNVQAQNALLKTLEEPPADTVLVLVATSPDALLPTIRSRCLRVAFAPLPAAAVRAALEAGGLPPGEARLAAALEGESRQRLRARLEGDRAAAEKAARKDEVPAPGWVELLRAAVRLGPEKPLEWLLVAAGFDKDREGAVLLCELLLVFWRDVLAVLAGAAALDLPDLEAEARAAARLGPAEALRRRAGVAACLDALERNAAAPLALERLLVGWFRGR